MERPWISIEETPEYRDYEDYLDAEEAEGGVWISFEEFLLRFPRRAAPEPVREDEPEDDIAF